MDTFGNVVGECVKYRLNIYVRKFVGDCGSYCQMPTENIPSVKSSVIIFKYVFKKLFRIHNIKLYKLMVIKTNYANKIFIKHKKHKKIKINNIHYKLNVFQKKILNELLKVNNIYYKLI